MKAEIDGRRGVIRVRADDVMTLEEFVKAARILLHDAQCAINARGLLE